MSGKPKNESLRQKAFAWLDGNASVLNRNQLYDGLCAEFNLPLATARVYASNWRKSNGVQRVYRKRKEEANGD